MTGARKAQLHAAAPGASTWLSANAGSGKTRVLTERVARLLLNGAPPENILCLTYTKAAASEMQNRLFKMLGKWAMKGDDDLREVLAEIDAPTATTGLDDARRLFALAIEAPGGLKIQTIHAYCASVLRRFPLEAGIAADFREIEDEERQDLLREAARELATSPEFEAVAAFLPSENLISVLNELSRRPMPAVFDEPRVRQMLGLGTRDDIDTLLTSTFASGDAALLGRVAAAMDLGKPTDVKAAPLIRLAVWADAPSVETLIALEDVFLTKEAAKVPFSAKIGSLPTKATGEALGADFHALNTLMERVEMARPIRIGLAALERARAIHAYGLIFTRAFQALKAVRGALDFDDLIRKVDALFSGPAGQWVAFRLDGEIDHILVDEAQDTSPDQWRVIAALASEITAGLGARDMARTIFAVGDKKQSIFSFQGADPAEFDRMQSAFGERLAAMSGLRELELAHSFRSAPAILQAVDQTFAHRGAEGLGQVSRHIAFDETRPGRVDFWPLITGTDESVEEPEWHDPVDKIAQDHPSILLARAVARDIRRLCEEEVVPDGEGAFRRVEPKDILILVRRRSHLFHHIIRACKAEGVPIAGADRFRVGAELAVKDLLSHLAFLALPDDDLALAETLRSPIYGFSEDELFELAHGRGKKTLWKALRDRREDHLRTYEALSELLDDAEFLRPYELLERILTRHQARARLIGRLSDEAKDGIDELLAQALRFESQGPPTLTGFVNWARRGDVVVKRGQAGETTQVRVMTVHGAKGLESPIVYLPDTIVASQGRRRGNLTEVDGVAFWSGQKDTRPEPVEDAIAAKSDHDAQEEDRLLYVAMTRAEHWLIVAGASKKEAGEDDWHSLVETGLRAAGAGPFAAAGGDGLRLDSGVWGERAARRPLVPEREAHQLPDWIARPAPTVPDLPARLSPSALPGAKSLPGEDGSVDAALFGDVVHKVLEIGRVERADEFGSIAGAQFPDAPMTLLARAVEEAKDVMRSPEFEPWFARDALAEVSLSAPFGGARIFGQLDRLIVTRTHVRFLDFKTNRTLPDSVENVPQGILAQLGAYAFALSEIYPGRVVEPAIGWTAGPRIQWIPHKIVMAAFQGATAS